ncbi:SRPBCC domain-containing protein [Sinomonas susongensis]|uniref:SRPBCC domain-containing protein n=1 Tax=Sinomonas susongensis TaxID=1324851 RepID=UPI001BB11ABB|nr:SRPBCC domain-containing protein [Sinomonas susongensis]
MTASNEAASGTTVSHPISSGPAVTDRIDKSIDIAAPPERVFALVSEPGWFINDGEYRAHEIDRDGDVSLVHDPVHGDFGILTVALEAPRLVVFRWVGEGAGSTLLEFSVEANDGGSRLRVVETGFASLPGSDADRRAAFEGNSQGWDIELEVARAVCENAA